VYISTLDDDVAKVDADPKCDPLLLWCPGIARCHSLLHGESAGDGLDHAGEFYEDPVAGRLDDASAMFADFGVDQFAAMRVQLGESTFLVGTHQPAISRDVRGENGGQPAFDALPDQSGAP
jgi:hypothetical protein